MKYADLTKTTDGRIYARVFTDENERVMIQINNVTWEGMGPNDEGGVLKFTGCDVSKITDIDNTNRETATTKSVAWFGKQLKENQLNAAYVSSIAGDLMNIPKATVGKKTVTRIFDHNHETIEDSNIPEGTCCDVILEFSGLWFLRTTFGPIWRIAQVRLKPPAKKIYPNTCLFNDITADSQEGDDVEEDEDDDYV